MFNSSDTYVSVQGYFGFTSAQHWLVCILYAGVLIVAGLFAIYSLHKQFLLHYSSSDRIRACFNHNECRLTVLCHHYF